MEICYDVRHYLYAGLVRMEVISSNIYVSLDKMNTLRLVCQLKYVLSALSLELVLVIGSAQQS